MSDETIRFLETLFGGATRGYVTLTPFSGGRPGASRHFDRQATSIEDIARVALALDAGGSDVYVRTQLNATRPEKGRGLAENSLGLVTLIADLDVAGPGHADEHSSKLPLPATLTAALAILAPFPDPTFIVSTGGGVHCWWAVRGAEDLPVEEARSVSSRWARALTESAEVFGLHVDPVGDLARVLRIPGTHNRKPRYPEPIPIEIMAEGPTYTLDGLRPFLAAEAPEPRAPAAGTGIVAPAPELPRAAAGQTAAGVTAAWSAAVDWAQILEPAGGQLARDAGNGERHWTRPGKSVRDGISAITHDDPPVMVNFSTGWAGLPVGEGNRVTKLRALAYLYFGGDEQSAWRSIAPALDPTDPERLAAFVEKGDPERASGRLRWAARQVATRPDGEDAVLALIHAGIHAGLSSATATRAAARGFALAVGGAGA